MKNKTTRRKTMRDEKITTTKTKQQSKLGKMRQYVTQYLQKHNFTPKKIAIALSLLATVVGIRSSLKNKSKKGKGNNQKNKLKTKNLDNVDDPEEEYADVLENKSDEEYVDALDEVHIPPKEYKKQKDEEQNN